ncbi:MAG: nucleoside triphosphate pyrophosphohydrolase [bacterium]|nr:nucleoside triphosphate pyrophosphohydrolase [bacterium]
MSAEFEELLATIHTLRAPGGCPWDRKQTLVDAARYLLDEAGELVDAALSGDGAHVREELGDLLFMTCFCCEILGETDGVSMHDIARQGNGKLIRRHPHVFGDAEAHEVGTSQKLWNEIKAQEKREQGLDPALAGTLKDMPASTAPLHLAYRWQKDAAGVGFDWPDLGGVKAKLAEELAELEQAEAGGDPEAIEHELGDVLFSLVNLARWHRIQPDLALRRANRRFAARFRLVESAFRARGRALDTVPLEELEAAWQEAKRSLAADSAPDSAQRTNPGT